MLGGVGVHVVYVPVNLKVMLSHGKLPQRHNASELSVWVSCGEMRAPLLRRGNHALFFLFCAVHRKVEKTIFTGCILI